MPTTPWWAATGTLFLLLFLILTIGHALTLRPWSDEGHFANAAYTLATHGYLGTPVLGDHAKLPEIQRYTYWVLPFHLLNLAAFYKLFGFSLLATRAVSILYGLGALAAVFWLVFALTRDRLTAAICVVVVGLEYNFLLAASFGRMDITAAALGLGAYAAYVGLRRPARLTAALLVSNALLALAALTHPAAILYAFGLLFLVLYYDRKQLRWRHVLAVAAPYLIGAAAYGAYILESPGSYWAQIRANAAAAGRLSGVTDPIGSFLAEFTHRYRNVIGLPQAHADSHAGPIALKLVPWVAFLASLMCVLLLKPLRRAKPYRPLLALWAIHFLGLSLLEGQKLSIYVVHIAPLFAMLCGVTWVEFWRRKLLPRTALAAAGLLLVAIPVGGILLKIRTDTYHKNHLPAVAFLQRTARPPDVVMGYAGLGFDYGFAKRLLDDSELGCRSHIAPAYIVIEQIYRNNVRDMVEAGHPCADFLTRRLSDEYTCVYDHNFYQVYARREGGSAE